MLRWSFRLFVLALVVYGFVLAEAHWEMARTQRWLPKLAELKAVSGGSDGPVRVRYVNSGTQVRPEGTRGTYGGFLLEWPDGRAFAIDLGMRKDVTRDFGATMEWLGAQPVEPYGALAELLGADAKQIAAVGFSHLHYDHTDGIAPLCTMLGRELPVYQTPDQYSRGNFATWPGQADLEEAECVARKKLSDGPLYEVPGFPGLAAFGVGGHTPGSTVFVANLRGHTWLFAGDVTNDFQNLVNDVPKPLAYSLLLIPESRSRLQELRVWLRDLDARDDFTVVVAHDLDRIVDVGIETLPR